MPSRNTIRHYEGGQVHHVYNRGVEKRLLFIDNEDYEVFLYYMLVYLLPVSEVLSRWPKTRQNKIRHNLSQDLHLLAYCLMPNHIHLLMQQKADIAISCFMQQVMNGYVKYFNKKYDRIGSLMESVYKAVEIEDEQGLIWVSRYIHLNPLKAGLCTELTDYRWSSFIEYAGSEELLCDRSMVMSSFVDSRAYREFVVQVQPREDAKLADLEHLLLDSEEK